MSPEEAIQQNRQHHQGQPDIEPITFARKRIGREDDARNRSRDQQQDSHLNDAAPPAFQRETQGSSYASQLRRLATKQTIIGMQRAITPQIENAADKCDGGGQKNTCPQQIADDLFYLRVVPASWIRCGSLRIWSALGPIRWGRHDGYSLPVRPL